MRDYIMSKHNLTRLKRNGKGKCHGCGRMLQIGDRVFSKPRRFSGVKLYCEECSLLYGFIEESVSS